MCIDRLGASPGLVFIHLPLFFPCLEDGGGVRRAGGSPVLIMEVLAGCTTFSNQSLQDRIRASGGGTRHFGGREQGSRETL